MPLGSKLTPPRGHNFTLNYIRKSSNDIFSWTAYGNMTKLNRNGPWVVPYQNCLNGSDWLDKYVTGSKNRFLKCNFQKSCLKLQGPELSYLVYSIILASSINIWWTTLLVLCKWLYHDPWPFPQVSDLGPFGPSCLIIIKEMNPSHLYIYVTEIHMLRCMHGYEHPYQ